jgi:hypothetical protein
MRKTAWQIGAMSFVAACGGNSPSNPDGTSPVGAQYNVTETGVVTASLDTLDQSVQAPVASPSPDWLELRMGQLPPVYLPKAETAPDASLYHFGRTDLDFPTKHTAVDVELDGLAWHDGDTLQLVVPNVGVSIHNFETHFAYPQPGSSSVRHAEVAWERAGSPLIDSAKGDVTWIAEMASVPSVAGPTYNVLTRAAAVSNLAMSDGKGTTLGATLAPVSLDRTLALRWNGAAFAALAKQAGPYARVAAGPALAIRALPEAIARNGHDFVRNYNYLPSLVDFGMVSGTQDMAETVHYGDPFPTKTTKWTELVTVVYAMPVVIPDVGATYAMVVQASSVDDVAANGLTPAISPVRNVKVNGQAADAPLTGTGASPTISWDAPAIGASTTYAVTVQAIAKAGQGHTITTVGTFRTIGTSLTLPELATKTTASYVLTITAIAAKDRDPTKTPMLGSLPYASADYVTARITP